MSLIFDIETIGSDFDSLDEVTRHNLTRWIKRQAGNNKESYNAMLQDLKEGLGFSPLTGEIVALGVLDTEANKGVVYFNAPGESIADFKTPRFPEHPEACYGDKRHEKTLSAGSNASQEGAGFTFRQKTEPEMLESFWQGAKKYNEFVSFNGRCFDVPFLAIRSAAHKIRPSKDLMSRRYLLGQAFNAKHIDLLDQLSFYGAVRRKGSLHLYCNAFNIKSPKAEGITGDDVGRLFKEGKYKEIAEYNSWDLIATRELYDVWRRYIK